MITTPVVMLVETKCSCRTATLGIPLMALVCGYHHRMNRVRQEAKHNRYGHFFKVCGSRYVDWTSGLTGEVQMVQPSPCQALQARYRWESPHHVWLIGEVQIIQPHHVRFDRRGTDGTALTVSGSIDKIWV
jgi:hypothetical protein